MYKSKKHLLGAHLRAATSVVSSCGVFRVCSALERRARVGRALPRARASALRSAHRVERHICGSPLWVMAETHAHISVVSSCGVFRVCSALERRARVGRALSSGREHERAPSGRFAESSATAAGIPYGQRPGEGLGNTVQLGQNSRRCVPRREIGTRDTSDIAYILGATSRTSPRQVKLSQRGDDALFLSRPPALVKAAAPAAGAAVDSGLAGRSPSPWSR
jgi:hypothetical protein